MPVYERSQSAESASQANMSKFYDTNTPGIRINYKEGGAFFQREREYIEQENKTTPAFYRPVHPDSKYAAIFLRPGMCSSTPARLNHTFLHETGHHIQHCRNLPCCRSRPENEVFASLEWKDQPWEIHAEQFAYNFQSNTFLQMVPHRLERSDLRYL